MMSWNHDSNHRTELVVGVAAAAYVINMTAEPSFRQQKKTGTGLEPSLINDKSRKEDAAFSILKPGTISEQFSDAGWKKGSESAERKVPLINAADERATRLAPSSEPDLRTVKSERTASKPDRSTLKPVSTAPKPDHPAIKPGTTATRAEQPPIKPVAPGIEAKRQSAVGPGTDQTKAEAWEKAKMAKIKERYVKLNSTILAWEEKQKKKARNKLDKAEKSESEQKRARALTKFRNKMDYIKQVADGATAEAQARQRNEELKAKEKANIIRTTGELPKTCFCC